jgi:serine-type D-Ala-D-Ala carboxypeptidase (penicillin-binding protein 5/6)
MTTIFSRMPLLKYLFFIFVLLFTIQVPIFTAFAAKNAKQGLTILGTPKDITKIKNKPIAAVVAAKKKEIKRRVSARSTIVMDAKSGEILFARNPDKQRQPASTIKVLTGILAIKSLKTSDAIPVSRRAANMPSSKIYLDQRRKYQANDLINAVLLASANDASVALAEKIADSEKSFAELMTKHAKQLGASKTICKTATGLTAKGQKSTARDLAIIFNEAMKNQDFAARMKKRKVRTVDGTLLRNHNKALWKLKGTLAGKTGYTNAARQTYVGKFKNDEDEIVVAILGSESMWSDLKRLVEYGFAKKLHQHEIAEQRAEARDMILADSTSSE